MPGRLSGPKRRERQAKIREARQQQGSGPLSGLSLPNLGGLHPNSLIQSVGQGFNGLFNGNRKKSPPPAAAAAPAPKNMSRAMQLGNTDGLGQAKGGLNNLAGDPQTRSAIEAASKATGQSVDDLTAMAIIESTGNRHVGTNAYGYSGLMQMGRAAAKDVGMSYGSLLGGGNVKNNALAGAKYMNVNAKRLDKGIPQDPLHLYLAHQQGAGGTNALMETLKSNPKAAATRNQRNNLPGAVLKELGGNVTQQDFYDYWKGKMGAIQSSIQDSKKK